MVIYKRPNVENYTEQQIAERVTWLLEQPTHVRAHLGVECAEVGHLPTRRLVHRCYRCGLELPS